MNKIIVNVSNGQIQDVPLGMSGDVIQAVRITNESPLQTDLTFGNMQDSLSPWKWNTYDANSNAAVLHIESAVLPGASSNGPSSSLVVQVYQKDEPIPSEPSGSLLRQAALNPAPSLNLVLFESMTGTLVIPRISEKAFYTQGFRFTCGQASTSTDIEIVLFNEDGPFPFLTWWVTNSASGGAKLREDFAQAQITYKMTIANGPTNQSLIVWGYYQ